MWFSSWLRNPKRSALSQHRRTPTVPRQRSTFRPQLEVLEARDVPSILTVTTAADWAVGSLRYEIGQAAAKKADTIVFAPSLRGQTITLSVNELDITNSLTIQGPGAGFLTINGGRNRFRVFEVDGYKTTVTLSGLTISNGGATGGDLGSYDGYGGAILNFGRLTVSGCTLSGNHAGIEGGAIYNVGQMTISSSTLSGNSAGFAGGGIFNDGAMTVSSCTLSANSAWSGGGMENVGTITVSGCTLSGNSATPATGGGIINLGTMTVSGCTLSGNSAGEGGGIYNSAGTLTVSSCTISGNYGGIYNYNGASLTVSNSVFSANGPFNIFGSYTDGGGNIFN